MAIGRVRLAIGIGLLHTLAAQAQTRTLVGYVVDQDQRRVESVELALAGIGGSIIVGSDGAFRYDVPSNVNSVVVVLLRPKEHVIRYPPGGRLPITVNQEPQAVIVGPSIERVALEASIDSALRIESLVARQGKSIDSLAALMESLGPLISKMNLETADVEEIIVRRRKRYEVFSEVTRMLDVYALRLRDLVVGLEKLAPHAATDPGSLQGLQAVVVRYSESYEAFAREEHAFEGRIEQVWDPGQVGTLRGAWKAIVRIVKGRIHVGLVLPLNDPLIALQVGFNTGKISDAAKEDALARLRDTTTRIREQLAELEEAISGFRETLDLTAAAPAN